MKSKVLPFSILLNIIFLVGLFVIVYRFGGVHTVWHKIKNRGLSAHYEHRKDLFMKLELQKGDIVFLGNSITEQCEWAELFGNPIVKNRGISGDGVEGVLSRLDRIIAAEPSKVCLMIGVNDLFFHEVDWVVPHYKAILKKFKDKLPQMPVGVQSVLPVNGSVKFVGVSNTSIVQLNEEIKKLALEFGYEYIDLHARFKDEAGQLKAALTEDGLHLNGQAYLLWKEILETDLAQ